MPAFRGVSPSHAGDTRKRLEILEGFIRAARVGFGGGWEKKKTDRTGKLDLSIYVHCLHTKIIKNSATGRTFINIMRPHSGFQATEHLLTPDSLPVCIANASGIWNISEISTGLTLIQSITTFPHILTIQTCLHSRSRMFYGKHFWIDGIKTCERHKGENYWCVINICERLPD